MKQISLFLLLGLLFVACSDDDKGKAPIFVNNIVISNADKIFTPGETLTISAESFQDTDQFMLEFRWPLPEEPIKEGYARGIMPDMTERTATRISFLVPGHLPASTLEVFLMRSGELMSLGKVSVADGQAPKEWQLYGITNSRSMNSYPRGIEHLDLTTGTPTEVYRLSQGEDFSLALNSPGSWTLCGMLAKDGEYSISGFDLSINHWRNLRQERPITLFTDGNKIFTIMQADEKQVYINYIPSFPYSRETTPTPAVFTLPEGMKAEALSRYAGVMTANAQILLSADNGDGTFSPVLLDLDHVDYKMRTFDPIIADALIPFWITQPKDENNNVTYYRAGGYAIVSKANTNGTELCLWNATTNSLEEPFATFPNPARSVAPHFTEDCKTQELYVLFDTNRGSGIIQIYDLLKKDWKTFPNFNFPYSEIVFAR